MLVSVSLLVSGLMLGGFGQFGFQHTHKLDYFEVSPTQFRSLIDDSNIFRLSGTREGLNFAATNRFTKALSMRPVKGAPLRIVYETGTTGFSMEFRDGFSWDVASGEMPFITWSEGSVGPGVSSPPSKWALLTWKEAKSPILFCFSTPTSLIVEETGNGYRVKSDGAFAGWVRIRAPFGSRRIATSSARELGEVAAKLKASLSESETPAPRVIGFDSRQDGNYIIANWKFDRAGTLLPLPLEYGVKKGLATILSSVEVAQNLDGRNRTASPILTVRFSSRKVSNGIAVCVGSPLAGDAAATVSGSDVLSVCDAVFSTMYGNSDAILFEELSAAQAEFYGRRRMIVEPVSGLKCWFGRDGGGILLATGFAILKSVRGDETELEGLLGTVSWTDWLPMGLTEAERISAGSLLSIGAAMSSSPEWRVLGAMANIGAMYKSEKSNYTNLRKAIYFGAGKPSDMNLYFPLFSNLRILSGDAFGSFDGSNLILSGIGEKGKTIVVVIESPVSPVVLPSGIKVESVGNVYRFQITLESDAWKVKIPMPGLNGIPKAVPSPRYSVSQR